MSQRQNSEPNPPTLRDVLAVLFRQKHKFLIAFTAVFVAIAVYGLAAKSYEAHMKVLIRRGRLDPVVTAEQALSVLNRTDVTEEEVNSEVELLKDENLLRRLVEESRIAHRTWMDALPFRDNSHKAMVERAVRRLARHLKIEPSHKANLITVRYEASDPTAAERVLSTLSTLYLEKHKQIERPTGQFPFFAQQTASSEAKLSEAESQLLDFSKQQGVVSAALERDLQIQRVSDLDRQFQQIRVDLKAKCSRMETLQQQLAQLPARSVSVVRTADNPELMQQLKAKLLSLELQRIDLESKYEPSYRLVQEVRDQIAQTKTAIQAEEFAPPRDETTEKDPDYQWTKSELEKTQVELNAIESSQTAVAIQLVAARATARQLGADAVRQQDLMRSMKTAEDTYLLYAKKSEEARISDALDEHGIVNVAIAETPVAPALPKYSAVTVVGFAFIAAGALSSGLAFAADYLDPALRTPDEVVLYLETPVLASLPKEIA